MFEYKSFEKARADHIEHYTLLYKLRNDESSKIYKQRERVYDYEKDYLMQNYRFTLDSGFCKRMSNDFGFTNSRKLALGHRNRFFDSNYMRVINCYSEINLNINYPYRGSPNINLKMFLGNLKELAIGGQGEVGIPLGGSENLGDDFVIKKATTPAVLGLKREVTHEVFVGKVLNSLRTLIPNFVYTYGYFFDVCGDENRTPKKGIKSVCNTQGKSYYTLYERVEPGIALNKYTKATKKFSDFLEKYLQILFSLNTAQKLDFTHYDLHDRNVILRSLPNIKKFNIKYILEGKEYYIKTDYVATIIDYGFSYIKRDGISFGLEQMEDFAVFADKPNQISDAFKLLMFSIDAVRTGNFQKFELYKPKFEKLFRFFSTTESIMGIVVKRYAPKNKYYYQIAPTEKTRAYTHASFIKYILKTFEEDLKDIVTTAPAAPKGPVLGCSTGELKCYENPEKVVDAIGFSASTYKFLKNYSYGKLTPQVISLIRPNATKILSGDILKLKTRISTVKSFYKTVLSKVKNNRSVELSRAIIFFNLTRKASRMKEFDLDGIARLLIDFDFGYNIVLEVIAWMDGIYVFQIKLGLSDYDRKVQVLLTEVKKIISNTQLIFDLLSIFKNENELLFKSVKNKIDNVEEFEHIFKVIGKRQIISGYFKKLLAESYSLKP